MFSAVLAEQTVLVCQALPYRPGEFFLRELAPLRTVLASLPRLGLLVVNGYANLDPAGRPRLGSACPWHPEDLVAGARSELDDQCASALKIG